MPSSTKIEAKRGRPRAYDPQAALAEAMDVFWDKGYAATSLDDLSDAMGMNRPSIYAAFGDKRALYHKALETYSEANRTAIGQVLSRATSLRAALEGLYEAAIGVYLSPKKGARGCFVISTALTEATRDAGIQKGLVQSLERLDKALAQRIAMAQEAGEISKDADPAALGILASATLYRMAISARAGIKRAGLREIAQAAVATICGQPR